MRDAGHLMGALGVVVTGHASVGVRVAALTALDLLAGLANRPVLREPIGNLGVTLRREAEHSLFTP